MTLVRHQVQCFNIAASCELVQCKDEADHVNLQVISFCVLDNSEDTEKSPDELLKDNVEDPIDVNSIETSSTKVVESDGGEEMDIT